MPTTRRRKQLKTSWRLRDWCATQYACAIMTRGTSWTRIGLRPGVASYSRAQAHGMGGGRVRARMYRRSCGYLGKAWRWMVRGVSRHQRRAAAESSLRERRQFAHMRRIRLCHLALDTSPIGAHTTAASYLWARVPVTTLPGQHVMSRVAASLLLALARDQGARSACASATIVRSEDDYVAVARALARGAGAAEAAEAGEEALTRRDETPRSSAVLDAYAGIRECLRAATEPLDARLRLQAQKAEMEEKPRGHNEGRSDGGGRAVFASDSGSSFTGHPPSRAASPVVFDTARWVRDWERALMLAADLSVGTDTGLSTGAGAAGAAGFSLVVCSRLL